MKSKPMAVVMSVVAALLLTWGRAASLNSRASSMTALLDLTVTLVGIAGTLTVWVTNSLHGNEIWAANGSMGSVCYFLGNLALFISVLWGEITSPTEKYVLFTLRLPFFILLVPVFLCAIALAALMSPFRMLGDRFRTPLRMWYGLLNWLLGLPPGYRVPD